MLIFYIHVMSSLCFQWQQRDLGNASVRGHVQLSIVRIRLTLFFLTHWVPGSWDARIGGCQQNGLLIPRSPFSRHQPIERRSLPQWTSHWCISPKKSKLQWTLSVPKTWKLTIMWRHMATMALRGLLPNEVEWCSAIPPGHFFAPSYLSC
jgi:hypothetical protein